MAMVPISAIHLGERFRKDLGDLEPLAESIARQGLLQPIGINRDNSLVFGQRRLVACRDILGWTEIEARSVDVTSLVEGEYDENEIRKDFTPSERVAITEAIRTFRHGGDRKSDQTDNRPVDPVRTDEAAQKAGFSGEREFRRAKTVVDKAAPIIVEAMDMGNISISAAAEAAKVVPREAQAKLDPKDTKAALREAVRAGRPILDPIDQQANSLSRAWSKASAEARQQFTNRLKQSDVTRLDEGQLSALQTQWINANGRVRKRFGRWIEAQFGLKLISLPPVKGRRPPMAPGSN